MDPRRLCQMHRSRNRRLGGLGFGEGLRVSTLEEGRDLQVETPKSQGSVQLELAAFRRPHGGA